ncbi:M36 family metallopeptidase [uncultured Dokdonia sp.]|uniref:M36 family metallopeptidase n=1 Tax=uncultured Dokdonia sp. TaxID=575653 RepID=UPI00260E0A99|nr:M36 family metallopeptidase [uncultured Dokdonia sp.]
MFKKLHVFVVCICLSYLSMNAQSSPDVTMYLLQQVQNNDLNPSDIANYKITSQHISSQSGVLHIYFRQAFNGHEVIGTESSIHLKNGSIIQGHSKFIKDVDQKIGVITPAMNAAEAIQNIADRMQYTISTPVVQLQNDDNFPDKTIFSNGGISRKNIPTELVYSKLQNGKWVAAWEVSIEETNGANWYNFFVDATTGIIISKNNWNIQCSAGHAHDHTKEAVAAFNMTTPTVATATIMGNGTYNVYALPLATPLQGDRSIVSDPHDLTASPFGWHDTDGTDGAEFTVTQGNNVNARDGGDNSGYQPDGGADLIFDYPFNPVYSDADQSEDAAITNLFYWNNVIHDITYRYGFDEASGNFQVNNYGNGGLGNDSVDAFSQIDEFCNATFGSPPDGTSGSMNMFICGNRDGNVDNLVVVHEYGHGVSVRLTGGAANSGCLSNDEQMGEGWSDWYGAVLTIEADDVSTDLRPVGNWLFGQDENGPGIRAFPYTTDLAQDPRTYNSIQGTAGPHPLGSIWAAMLWEVTWGLIEEHGFDPDVYNGTGGNNIALALVTEGLKLQPCNPGFVDGRDAILAADVALFGGANQCIIWEAFAKRGLGFSADQGSSNSRNDGTEAFDSLSTLINTPDTIFCVSEDTMVLNGGIPVGGVYSGPGVTDNGDGMTYTFNPSAAGIGVHTITYMVDNECSDVNTDSDTIEVRSDTPILECQDVTIEVSEDGPIVITPSDVIANFPTGDNYTVDQTGDFAPIDINGTTVTLGDDQVSTALPIGFDFTFYGEMYQNFYISSNGFITFSSGVNNGCCSGASLPSADGIDNIVAFAWEDVNPSAGGLISYETIGSAPNRTLIMEFDNVPYFGSSNTVTSQVHLKEGSNIVEIHSASIPADGTMTQGIENMNGTDAVATPGRNATTWSATNDYVAFIPEEGVFPNNCGNETTVTLDIDTFNCDDEGENTVTITVTDTAGNTVTCTATVTIDCTLAIEENTLSDQVRMFPNPTSSSFSLNWDTTNSIEQLEIFDITGKKVKSVAIELGVSQIQVDVNTLTAGIYLVKANTTDGQTFIDKLIIK